MARVLTTGFELGDTPLTTTHPDNIWGGGTNSSLSSVTSPVRTGNRALQIATARTTVSTSLPSFSGTEIWTRWYFYIDVLPAAGTVLELGRLQDTTNLIQYVSVRLDETGTVSAYHGGAPASAGTQLSGTAVISTGTWILLEMYAKPGAGTGAATVWVNNSQMATGTSLNDGSGTLTHFVVQNQFTGTPGVTMTVDDLAINDNSGTTQNTRIGSGKVVLLSPISDNARVGFLNDASLTTSLFDDVNNTPPVGAASPAAGTQIQDKAANTTDTYSANLTTYTSAGIAAGDTLNAIRIFANHGYSAAAAASLGLQMTSNPAITEVTNSTNGSAAGVYPSNWTWLETKASYSGTLTANSLTVGTSPVLRVRHNTSSSSRSTYVDAMFAYVDYTPAPTPSLAPVQALRRQHRALLVR